MTLGEAAAAAGISELGAVGFLTALAAVGLVERDSDALYVPCADLADRRYQAGYLTWSLNANRPYIDRIAEFVRDPKAVGALYNRDGRTVPRTSRWIGSSGFYPDEFAEIVGRKPGRVVDLGASGGALLINLLTALPNASGVALDISAGACEEAEAAARRVGVDDRLQVVNRSVESLADDPSPASRSATNCASPPGSPSSAASRRSPCTGSRRPGCPCRTGTSIPPRRTRTRIRTACMRRTSTGGSPAGTRALVGRARAAGGFHPGAPEGFAAAAPPLSFEYTLDVVRDLNRAGLM